MWNKSCFVYECLIKRYARIGETESFESSQMHVVCAPGRGRIHIDTNARQNMPGMPETENWTYNKNLTSP